MDVLDEPIQVGKNKMRKLKPVMEMTQPEKYLILDSGKLTHTCGGSAYTLLKQNILNMATEFMSNINTFGLHPRQVYLRLSENIRRFMDRELAHSIMQDINPTIRGIIRVLPAGK